LQQQVAGDFHGVVFVFVKAAGHADALRVGQAAGARKHIVGKLHDCRGFLQATHGEQAAESAVLVAHIG